MKDFLCYCPHSGHRRIPRQTASSSYHPYLPTHCPYHPQHPFEIERSIFRPPLRLLFPPLGNPLEYLLPILIQLQLDDLRLARVDADRHRLTVRLFLRDALNVHDVFEAVDRCDFALTAFVAAAGDEDDVVFADGDGADLVRKRGRG